MGFGVEKIIRTAVKDSAVDPRKNTSTSWVQSPGGWRGDGGKGRRRETEREREEDRATAREILEDLQQKTGGAHLLLPSVLTPPPQT